MRLTQTKSGFLAFFIWVALFALSWCSVSHWVIAVQVQYNKKVFCPSKSSLRRELLCKDAGASPAAVRWGRKMLCPAQGACSNTGFTSLGNIELWLRHPAATCGSVTASSVPWRSPNRSIPAITHFLQWINIPISNGCHSGCSYSS